MKKTGTEIKIETTLDNFIPNVKFGYWDNKTEEFIPVTIVNVKNIAVVLGVSDVFLEAIVSLCETLSDNFNAINDDLKFLGGKIL